MASPSQSLYSNIKGRQIRLCDIAPGAFGDPISCKLRTASLDDDVEYDALSYMWGDGKDRRVISINGLELHVTSNLATALPFLRVDRIRTIWIDAICIYFDRYRTEYLRNLRFGPLFPEQVARRHPSEAKRVAIQYVRKGMHLMTMRGRDLTPERCYDAVVGDEWNLWQKMSPNLQHSSQKKE